MKHTIQVVSLSVMFCVAAYGQFDSGQIAGFVRDPSQAVIAGAKVTITDEGNGQKHRVVTNSTGYYVAPNLFVGTYTLEVEAPGFKKAVQTGIQLSAAAKLSIDIELTVGAVSDSVEVTSLVTSALQRIPKGEALLLESFHFEKRRVAELAAAYGVSERAIEGRLRRARERLRNQLVRMLVHETPDTKHQTRELA